MGSLSFFAGGGATLDSVPIASDNGFTPVTVTMWAYLRPGETGGHLMRMQGDTDAHHMSVVNGDFRIGTAADSSSLTALGLKPKVGEWQFYAGVWASETSRRAWLGQESSPESTGSQTPTDIDSLIIGRAVVSFNWPGNITRVAIFARALTDDEIAQLAQKKKEPTDIADLVAYYPMGQEGEKGDDAVGSGDLTVTGTWEHMDRPDPQRGRARRLVEIDGQYYEAADDAAARDLLRRQSEIEQDRAKKAAIERAMAAERARERRIQEAEAAADRMLERQVRARLDPRIKAEYEQMARLERMAENFEPPKSRERIKLEKQVARLSGRTGFRRLARR